MGKAFKLIYSELITLHKEVEEQKKLLNIYKTYKKGKRIALKGKFVFSTEEVLEIAKAAEVKPATKRKRAWPWKYPIEEKLEDKEDEILDSSSSSSDSDYIVVAKRK